MEEEEEEDREDELDFMGSRARMGKSSGKHELVFVSVKIRGAVMIINNHTTIKAVCVCLCVCCGDLSVCVLW